MSLLAWMVLSSETRSACRWNSPDIDSLIVNESIDSLSGPSGVSIPKHRPACLRSSAIGDLPRFHVGVQMPVRRHDSIDEPGPARRETSEEVIVISAGKLRPLQPIIAKS